MKKTLMAAALAATALTATSASAAELVNFTIDTEISGSNVPGSPTTAAITGQFDYDAVLAQSPTAVSNFSVLIGGVSFANFPAGVSATLSNFTGATGLLNFTSGASTIFSFNLAGLVSANGRPPAFGTTVSNASSFTYGDGTPITINAGSVGTLDAVAAVPEPATWAMMMLGFGMVGFGLRRRSNVKTTVSYA
jgi:opacity protein-like surface antigen